MKLQEPLVPPQAELLIDSRLAEWLPRAQREPVVHAALLEVSKVIAQDHGDTWLRDLLSGNPGGYSELARALKANLGGSPSIAADAASAAAESFLRGGNRAGYYRAEVERLYALHRSLQPKPCAELGRRLETELIGKTYLWILGQVRIERAVCDYQLGIDTAGARRTLEQTYRTLTGAGYTALALRAAGILIGLETTDGNPYPALDRGRAELERYFKAPFPPNRAQQIYFDQSRAACMLGFRYTCWLLARAAVDAIAQTPNRQVEALSRAHAAALAFKAGLSREAEEEFARAEEMFAQLPDDESLRSYRVDGELARAVTLAESGEPSAAIPYLEKLRLPQAGLATQLQKLQVTQALGLALWRTGQSAAARALLEEAVTIHAERLSALKKAGDRLAASGDSASAFRSLAELQIVSDNDPRAAYLSWQRLRGGSLQPGGGAGIDSAARRLDSETLVTYALFPSGIIVWVLDDRGLKHLRLKASKTEVEHIAARLLSVSADAYSPPEDFEKPARDLFSALVEPIRPWLKAGRTLVIEPDGLLGQIPWGALLNEQKQPLAAEHPVVVSGGLSEYLQRSKAPAITSTSPALLVADPVLGTSLISSFPPLPEAAAETDWLRRQLRSARMLTGEQATLSALERHLPSAQIFHFAGHGMWNAGNGALLLAGTDTGAEAAVLGASRIYSQDWRRCRLAVLSACSTGAGERAGPVNSESLVRALLGAGAARVMASLWNVDAVATRQFMQAFYRRALLGEAPSEAWRNTMLQLREEGKRPAYEWAAFQIYGYR